MMNQICIFSPSFTYQALIRLTAPFLCSKNQLINHKKNQKTEEEGKIPQEEGKIPLF